MWDFEKDGRVVNVRVEGQFIVNDTAVVRQAVDGLGLCYLPLDYLQAQIGAGELNRVLRGMVLAVPRLPSVLPKSSSAIPGPGGLCLGVAISWLRRSP